MVQLVFVASVFFAVVMQTAVATVAMAIDTNPPNQSERQDGAPMQEQRSYTPSSLVPGLTPQPTRMFEQTNQSSSVEDVSLVPIPANSMTAQDQQQHQQQQQQRQHAQKSTEKASSPSSNATASAPASSHEEAGHDESKKTSKPQLPAAASSKHKRKHDRSHSGDHDNSSGSKEGLSIDIQTLQRTTRPTLSPESQVTLELPPIPSNEDSFGNELNVQNMKTSDSPRPANALSAGTIAAASIVMLAVLSVTG